MMNVEVVKREPRARTGGIWAEVIDALFSCERDQAVRLTDIGGKNDIGTLRASAYLRDRLDYCREQHAMVYRLRTRMVGERAIEIWLEVDPLKSERLQEKRQQKAQRLPA